MEKVQIATLQRKSGTNSLARLIMDEILLYLRLKQRNMLQGDITYREISPTCWQILARYEKHRGKLLPASFA